ncbi:MAG TPA: iron-containing alcohol dehydrogenase, partial [Polyangia bacterium]|nr:iron-containing alcohol dehydrogenase [Polyangia bacterium]
MNVAESPPREGLAEALARLQSRRVLLICGPSRRYVDRLAPAFAGLELDVFAGARRHVPQDLLAEARARLDAFQADTVVALGGGSAIGFGKALRLERDVHFVAVPTTYAGSEMTTLWGTTQEGVKTTGRNPRVRPDAIIHDVDLTLEMPKALTVTSLMNALAHPISTLGAGALAAEAREPALAAITLVYGAIETLVRAPADRRARREAARGAGLAAAALELGKPGPHHALAHRLGGRFDLDHASLHSVLLPHSLRRLRDENPDLLAELSARLNVADLEDSLFEFLQRAGAPTSLRALGVSLEGLNDLLGESPELPKDLLRAAFHGRRPSGATRFEDWGLSEPVSVRGPQPESARRVIVALHGRGATADSILARAVEIAGNDPTVCVLAPQATDNVWYTGRYNVSRNELGPMLPDAIAAVESLLARVIERSAADRVVLFGFSQGACLAIEVTARLTRPIAAVVALSGASIGQPAEQPPANPGIAGLAVLLGSSQEDPYVASGHLERAAARLSAAGASVTVEWVPGNAHGLHGLHRLRARALLAGHRSADAAMGFGNVHQSEDLPGALPREQNSPRRVAYGLYAEQVNGTGFVAPRHENRRTWLYRVRPSANQSASVELPHALLASDFLSDPPEANLCGWAPLPLPPTTAAIDFVDGLATIGGAGSARLRRGFAV